MSTLPAGIRHVIVLMLENRSFDHLLGYLPNVDGPAGHSNIDPLDGSRVFVTSDAAYTSPALPDPAHKSQVTGDPDHSFSAVNRQLFEADPPAPGVPITCGGFIAAGRQSTDPDTKRTAREVMRCFDTPKQLVTIGALAADFVVCDQWFSSVPGPTWPNRLFVHAATSFGTLDDQLRLFEGTTIYELLERAGTDWAIYYHDVPQSLCLHELIDRRDRMGRKCMRPVREFFKNVRDDRSGAAAQGTLPGYVFIEPGYTEPAHGFFGRLFDALKWLGHLVGLPIQPSQSHANDQHPPHDVRLGEHLIADVYDALRANEDVWQHCLFVVLHDEHGGLYDHVPPPSATPPDPRSSATPRFVFDRAGLRVPAILVSPYLKRGTESTPYEHCSIVRTVREHFCPGAAPLTPRDAAAAPLRSGLFATTPRTDAPTRLARPTPVFAIPRTGNAAGQPLNDLQTNLLRLAAAVADAPVGMPGGPPSRPAGGPPGAAPQPLGGAALRSPGKVIDLTSTSRPPVTTEADGNALAQRLMQQRGLR